MRTGWVLCVLLVGCSSKDKDKSDDMAKAGSGSAVAPKPGALSADDCTKVAAAIMAKSFTNVYSDEESRTAGREYLVKRCQQVGWDSKVPGCVNGRGDPWTCIDNETAESMYMEIDPAKLKRDCSPIWPKASAWAFKGDEATTDLVQRSLMEALTAKCTEQGWTSNLGDCFEKAETPETLAVCVQMIAVGGDELAASMKTIVERTAGWSKLKPLACNEVVAKFYTGEFVTKLKMPRYSAADRQKAIDEAKRELAADCKDWTVARRQCFADAKTHADQMLCMDNNLVWDMLPIRGSSLPTKIAECDNYPALVKKCANTPGANGILESLGGVRDTLFVAEPGSDVEKQAIAACKELAKEWASADIPCKSK